MDQSDEAALEKVEQVISIDCQNSYSAMNMVIVASLRQDKLVQFEIKTACIMFCRNGTEHINYGQKVENEENPNFVTYLSKKSSKCDFNTFNIVKFDSSLVLMSSIFQFQNTFVP